MAAAGLASSHGAGGRDCRRLAPAPSPRRGAVLSCLCVAGWRGTTCHDSSSGPWLLRRRLRRKLPRTEGHAIAPASRDHHPFPSGVLVVPPGRGPRLAGSWLELGGGQGSAGGGEGCGATRVGGLPLCCVRWTVAVAASLLRDTCAAASLGQRGVEGWREREGLGDDSRRCRCRRSNVHGHWSSAGRREGQFQSGWSGVLLSQRARKLPFVGTCSLEPSDWTPPDTSFRGIAALNTSFRGIAARTFLFEGASLEFSLDPFDWTLPNTPFQVSASPNTSLQRSAARTLLFCGSAARTLLFEGAPPEHFQSRERRLSSPSILLIGCRRTPLSRGRRPNASSRGIELRTSKLGDGDGEGDGAATLWLVEEARATAGSRGARGRGLPLPSRRQSSAGVAPIEGVRGGDARLPSPTLFRPPQRRWGAVFGWRSLENGAFGRQRSLEKKRSGGAPSKKECSGGALSEKSVRAVLPFNTPFLRSAVLFQGAPLEHFFSRERRPNTLFSRERRPNTSFRESAAARILPFQESAARTLP